MLNLKKRQHIITILLSTQDYTSTDGAPLPRCNTESHFTYQQGQSQRVRCPAREVVNPDNVFEILINEDLRKETEYRQAVQIQPQHLSLKLRISMYLNLDHFVYHP